MKNIVILILSTILISIIQGCKENDRLLYHEKPSVYFSSFSEQDSLIHSLVGSPYEKDTIRLVVSLLGMSADAGLWYRVVIDPAYTTAVEGVHYEKLKDDYLIRGNEFNAIIPLVLYKGDPALNTGVLKLGLKLVETTEVGLGYPDKLYAKILFTNELVKPVYWEDFLVLYYGEYSKVKHQKCIDIQGFDFPASRAQIPTSMYGTLMSYGRLVCKYYTDNTVYDEDGNRILPWPAF